MCITTESYWNVLLYKYITSIMILCTISLSRKHSLFYESLDAYQINVVSEKLNLQHIILIKVWQVYKRKNELNSNLSC